MPDIYYQDGANLRHISDVYYQDGASLRTITEVWYQDGGVLRKVWNKNTALVYLENLFQEGTTIPPGTASASVRIKSSGTVQGRANTNPYNTKFVWLLVGSSGDYEVRATLLSGTTPSGSAIGTWLTTSSDRTWSVSSVVGGAVFSTLLIELRDIATNTIQASATFTIQAEVVV